VPLSRNPFDVPYDSGSKPCRNDVLFGVDLPLHPQERDFHVSLFLLPEMAVSLNPACVVFTGPRLKERRRGDGLRKIDTNQV
jgi:hypothetical protein